MILLWLMDFLFCLRRCFRFELYVISLGMGMGNLLMDAANDGGGLYPVRSIHISEQGGGCCVGIGEFTCLNLLGFSLPVGSCLCFLSDLNDGEGFFDGLIFLCMCGCPSMVAGLLLRFVPCVSSAVLVILLVMSGQLMSLFSSVRISMVCNLSPQSRSACRHCFSCLGMSM